MSSAPAILAVHSSREEWLLQRRELLTASDCAAVLGIEGAYGTPFSVWAEKVGDTPPDELTQDYVMFGRDVEGAIAAGYSRKFGRPVEDLGGFTIQRHPDIKFLGATLDRLTAGSEAYPAPAPGKAPAEFKAVGFSKVRLWHEEPPLPYVVQAQIQAACIGAEWASLCAIFGGVKLSEPIDILRNDDFLNAAYPLLEEFWRLVQRREPPRADGAEATTAALKRLWPTDNGQTVALDHDDLQLVAAWESARADEKKAEARAEEYENRLRTRLGEASFGALVDGSFLSLKRTNVKGYTRTVAPTSYRSLKRTWPRIPRRT